MARSEREREREREREILGSDKRQAVSVFNLACFQSNLNVRDFIYNLSKDRIQLLLFLSFCITFMLPLVPRNSSTVHEVDSSEILYFPPNSCVKMLFDALCLPFRLFLQIF